MTWYKTYKHGTDAERVEKTNTLRDMIDYYRIHTPEDRMQHAFDVIKWYSLIIDI